MRTETNQISFTPEHCKSNLTAIGDALYVIGGKWKLHIICALLESSSTRFNELRRLVNGISSRVLSSELKELELNGFIKKTVLTDTTVVATYELTEYSHTLKDVIVALSQWGSMHREKIRQGFSETAPATGSMLG